jgi:hypothetical protein
MPVCLYVSLSVCMHACVHVRMYVCMYACMYMCVHVCVCACVCMEKVVAGLPMWGMGFAVGRLLVGDLVETSIQCPPIFFHGQLDQVCAPLAYTIAY